MKKLIAIGITLAGIILYSLIGTGTRVNQIKKLAPDDIVKRGWTILRYEGFEYGSWGNHGGKVWYHVCNTSNHAIQYRVWISLWAGELQYHYGEAQHLSVFNYGDTNP